jgi:hypothetical protein
MPPPTLIATAGAPTANVYVTLAEADAFHEASLYGARWRGATVDEKRRALLTATRLLDEHIVWAGLPASTTQALAWPRTGVLDVQGGALSTSVVPTRVQHATAELARQLLAEDRTADSEIAAKGLTSLTVGAISMSFDGVGGTTKPIPDAVAALVAPWGAVQMAGGNRALKLTRA